MSTPSVQRLRELSNSLQHVREQERSRISRELHDDLGQQLTGLVGVMNPILNAGIVELLGKLVSVDPGNQYVIPWAWSFTTVAINKAKVAKALGSTPMPDNAWDLVFNPTYTSKLKSCGIAYLDSPTEILPPALHYVGKKAYSEDPADHKAAGEMLAKVRKDIRLFSSTMIDDLAGGKACAALGWAGDFIQAANRAAENKSGVDIEVPDQKPNLLFKPIPLMFTPRASIKL